MGEITLTGSMGVAPMSKCAGTCETPVLPVNRFLLMYLPRDAVYKRNAFEFYDYCVDRARDVSSSIRRDCSSSGSSAISRFQISLA